MKTINYQLYYKNNYYNLKSLNDKKIIYSTATFYCMYCYLKENNFDFSSISLPRLTLFSFFRDYASFDTEECI